MTQPLTTNDNQPNYLSVVEVIERIDAFDRACESEVGSIFPDNFFSSVRHYMLELANIVRQANGVQGS